MGDPMRSSGYDYEDKRVWTGVERTAYECKQAYVGGEHSLTKTSREDHAFPMHLNDARPPLLAENQERHAQR